MKKLGSGISKGGLLNQLKRCPILVIYVGTVIILISVMFALLYSDYAYVHDPHAHLNLIVTKSEKLTADAHTHAHAHGHIHTGHDKLDHPGDHDSIRPLVQDKPWGERYTPVRVWCLVPTLWPKKKETMSVIAETWGSFCDQLIFVIDDEFGMDAPDEFEGATILKLSFEHRQTTHDRNIWEKVWKMWFHVGHHHLNDADWFLKIDDDTFFSAVNFRGFARYFNPDKPFYFGHTLMHVWRYTNIAFNSGTCYAISRGALRKVYPIFQTVEFRNDPDRKRRGKKYCVHRAGDEEDPTFGICLKSMGIIASNTLDKKYRERFLPFRPDDHAKIEKANTWFWRYKHPEVGVKENCCSPNPISFHNFKRNAFRQFKALSDKYNQPEGVNGKVFEVPDPPQWHLVKEPLDFQVDEWRNIARPPKGQRVYKGPGKERTCFDCDSFTYK